MGPASEALPAEWVARLSEVRNLVGAQWVDEPDDDVLLEGALRGLVGALDRYSRYAPSVPGDFGELGVVVEVQGGSVEVVAALEGGPAWGAGIQAGDRIVGIDGVPARFDDATTAAEALAGAPGTHVTLQLAREEGAEEGVEEVVVERALVRWPSVEEVRELEDGVAVVRLAGFASGSAQEVRDALAALGELRGLVLDVRGNPGGSLRDAVGVCDLFVEAGRVVVEARARSPGSSRAHRTRLPPVFGGALAVLVDRGSASASEVVAGALQAWGRALVVGEPTFGKGSVQTGFPVGHGRATVWVTTQRFATPEGVAIEGVGVEPDVRVELTDAQRWAVSAGAARRALARLRGEATSEGVDDDPVLARAVAALR